MSLFRGLKTQAALSRLQEEQIYEYILDEIESGSIRRGLMAKAISISKGDENRVQAEYITLRLQSLIDENAVLDAIESMATQTQPSKMAKPKKERSRDGSLASHRKKVERQKEFELKPTKKGNSGNFWNSLRDEFDDARRDERESKK